MLGLKVFAEATIKCTLKNFKNVMHVLSACMPVHQCMPGVFRGQECLLHPLERSRQFWATTCVRRTDMGLQEEQYVLLTTEPSLQLLRCTPLTNKYIYISIHFNILYLSSVGGTEVLVQRSTKWTKNVKHIEMLLRRLGGDLAWWCLAPHWILPRPLFFLSLSTFRIYLYGRCHM